MSIKSVEELLYQYRVINLSCPIVRTVVQPTEYTDTGSSNFQPYAGQNKGDTSYGAHECPSQKRKELTGVTETATFSFNRG